MVHLLLALFLAALPAQGAQAAGQPAQDDIKSALAQAENLYYEARFNESIKILLNLSEILKTRPDRLQDHIATKLQLALANIGLNDTSTAKQLLAELYALDSNYVLDAKQYSPKVIALANDAKNEQRQIQCQKARESSRTYLTNRDGASLEELLRSTKGKCPELAQIEPEAAELFYKQGLEQYKQGNFQGALQSFRTTLRMSPSHELALQYRELTESKLQIAEERLLIQWQKNFDAGNYKDAAADYRAIQSRGEFANAAALAQATAEYRKALTLLVDNWGQACASGNESALATVQNKVTELLPDPSFAGDLRSRMVPCPKPEPAPPEAPKIAGKIETKAKPPAASPVNRIAETRKPQPSATASTNSSCFQMDPQVAMTRLKTRVDPVVPREALAFIRNTQVTVRVKVRIDMEGKVTVIDTTGGNSMLTNSVRAAVEQWDFSPARDEKGTRCVDTEIPVAVRG